MYLLLKIYMKPSREEREDLQRRVIAARAACALTDAEIARRAEVDPGQSWKICRGGFRTFNESVLKICNVLDVAVAPPVSGKEAERRREQPATGPTPSAGWRRLESAVRRAWDKTPEGADRLARVIDAVGRLDRG